MEARAITLDAACDDTWLDRRQRRDEPALWSARGRRGVVATAHYRASMAAVDVLEAGGNALDAAVTASLALGVTEPAGSGLGGMTMMTVHLASGRTFVVEGGCRAPAGLTAELAAGSDRRRGWRAIALPMNAAVLGHVHDRYGRLPRAEVVAPAIHLARSGVPVTPLQWDMAEQYALVLRRLGGTLPLVDSDGRPWPVGHLVVQPALAAALERLSEAGFDDFYTGEIGRTIAQDMREHGGWLSERDLGTVPSVRELASARAECFGWDVCSLPPPGGGYTLLQMLRMAERVGSRLRRIDTPAAAVLLAAIIQRARLDRRARRLEGGRAQSALLNHDTVADAADQILDDVGVGETTHVSIVDGDGNAVAMTQSIERSYGAGVASPSLGFLYNGYMKGFKVQARRHPHFLRPGAVARSNAGPTIVLERGRPVAVVGSTGSERMCSGIFQVLMRRFAGQDPFDAVAAPRLHCTPEGEVLAEIERFPEGTREALERCGLRLTELPPWSFKMGGLHLVAKDGDAQVAVAEPRRDGAGLAAR